MNTDLSLTFGDNSSKFEIKHAGKKVTFEYDKSTDLITVMHSTGLNLSLVCASLTVDHFLAWMKDLKKLYSASSTADSESFAWNANGGIPPYLQFQSLSRLFIVRYSFSNDQFSFEHAPVPLSGPPGIFDQTWKIMRKWVDLGFKLPIVT